PARCDDRRAGEPNIPGEGALLHQLGEQVVLTRACHGDGNQIAGLLTLGILDDYSAVDFGSVPFGTGNGAAFLRTDIVDQNLDVAADLLRQTSDADILCDFHQPFIAFALDLVRYGVIERIRFGAGHRL